MTEDRARRKRLAPFSRVFFGADESFMQIGTGACGGKASGLLDAFDVLTSETDAFAADGLALEIPVSLVVGTGVYERFLSENALVESRESFSSDGHLSHVFQSADFPTEYVGDLLALVRETAGRPLAIRSSSLLEDDLSHPFAGVYRTKMIPNDNPDPAIRFQRLIEAIKFVYASAWSAAASDYMRALEIAPERERMAVLIQEIVGRGHGDRFYPDVSGVCKSFNYYRTGASKPDEGVVSLALGLGKTIVDGGAAWSYSPAHPRAGTLFASVSDLMKYTQLDFWAVRMGKPESYDPTRETEYLVKAGLADADYDGTLAYVASTWDADRERLMVGVAGKGPRVVDFAPLLKISRWPVNEALQHLLAVFRRDLGYPVEIEFALTFDTPAKNQIRLVVLQVRPMMISRELIDLSMTEHDGSRLIIYSDRVMGNGVVEGLRDIVYVKPERFERSITANIAEEVGEINRSLLDEGKRCLLIGFGRWGSSERWLGIPVAWGQISTAAVIVESTLEEINVDLSQGSHFFHNLESLGVSYFSVDHASGHPIDWEWLGRQTVARESENVRHVCTSRPLTIRVDGRTGRGAVWRD